MIKHELKIKRLTAPALLGVAALFVLGLSLIIFREKNAINSAVDNEHQPAPAVVEIDRQQFEAAIAAVNIPDQAERLNIRGGIVPHHETAGFLIAEFFSSLKHSIEPETFIIIGPDHDSLGNSLAMTAPVVWQTGLGLVQPDIEIVNGLIEHQLAAEDFTAVASEHAIWTLLPYLKYYFPAAKVAPIVLNHELDPNEARNLAGQLSRQLADKKAVVLASVDFSHYLSREQAGQRDSYAKQMIQARNYSAISRFDDQYADSAPALLTLLMIMDELNANNSHFINHANSADFAPADARGTTSYYTIFFY